MRNLLVVVCALCLSSSFSLAWGQGKTDSQWNCGKATEVHSLDVSDEAGHAYVILKNTCTAAKGEIEGLKEKEGALTEFDDVNGNRFHGHGVFVETLDNGDKLYVNYEIRGTMDNGQLTSASNMWNIANGTSKFKGAKGKGSCKGKANADGSATFDCMGEYTLAK
jgi:hypothetical protein